MSKADHHWQLMADKCQLILNTSYFFLASFRYDYPQSLHIKVLPSMNMWSVRGKCSDDNESES